MLFLGKLVHLVWWTSHVVMVAASVNLTAPTAMPGEGVALLAD